MKKMSASGELIRVYGISSLLVIAAFFVAYQFVGPAPTKNIKIATGGRQGAYFSFGQQYADYFNNSDVSLTVLDTAGSIDNLERLADPDSGVHAALVQGGVSNPQAHPLLESLGSLYYEPLWLFHRASLSITDITDLKNMRIALGSQGSGTYALASQLLARNGITPQTAQFVELLDQTPAAALITGAVDALFLVAGTDSPTVRALLQMDAISLYSFRRAEAYTRNYKYLSQVILPVGSVDFERNIPASDTALVAPTANLVVRKDLHPALMYLFMMAAEAIHHQGGLLEARGNFPSPESVTFPLNKEARRFYKSGPPFLMKMLPFWIATWLVRMFVMIIPLLTILYPLFKIAPPTYAWRVRRKVNKYYKALHDIDLDVARATSKTELIQLRQQLDDLEKSALSVQVPASYMDAQYALRRHMTLLRQRIDATCASFDA